MAITNGGLLNSTPASQQAALSTNYLDLASTANQGWAQQYVPDLMEKEAEVFGPRTISGFLNQIGAEEAMTADQVVWSEQGRLHLAYTGEITDGDAGTIAGGQITIGNDIDGQSAGSSHGIRKNDTVIIASSEGTVKALVTLVTAGSAVIEVAPYGVVDLNDVFTDSQGANSVNVLVYGSEFKKGDNYDGSEGRGANEPQFKSFTNKPVIMKDYYEVSGSDAARIGWVEVASEMGAAGYLWYLKAEADTRARFTDYLEMTMLEAVKGGAAAGYTGGVADLTDNHIYGSNTGDVTGTQGLFNAIEERGNVTSGVTGVNAATDLAEFDAILAEFD